jgi:hypothetical protein
MHRSIMRHAAAHFVRAANARDGHSCAIDLSWAPIELLAASLLAFSAASVEAVNWPCEYCSQTAF